jgi:hypothetical protein
MSTDLYGVRVIGIFPEERRVRLRVFVVYYEANIQSHQELPDDASFFFRAVADRALDKRGPLSGLSVEQYCDETWVNANAWRWIDRFERVATRNHPVATEAWEHIHDFYYERYGRWKDEDTLVQADYDVWFIDGAISQYFTLGEAWGTTAYPTQADRLTPEDLPRIPDVRNAVETLTPFADATGSASTPTGLAFSPDGKRLAITNEESGIAVYTVGDWSELLRSDEVKESLIAGRPTWASNDVVVIDSPHSPEIAGAWSVATKTMVDAPEKVGATWTSTGYRLSFGVTDELEIVAPDGSTRSVDGGFCVEAIHPAARTSTRQATAGPFLLAGGMSRDILLIDLGEARIVERFENVAKERVTSMTSSPDGAYVFFCEYEECGVLRIRDREVIVREPCPSLICAASWSPDGRFAAANIVDSVGAGGETRIFAVGIDASSPLDAPTDRDLDDEDADPDEEPMNPAMMKQLAMSSDLVSATEWRALLEDHALWLKTGGGEGDGSMPDGYEPPWNVVNVAGLALAVYTGQSGASGKQAVLRLRRLTSDQTRGLSIAWADLTACVGESLDFSDANLIGCCATDAFLPGARLRAADLRLADFSRTDLRGADLTGANLELADFQNADLTNADFTGARISGINLKGAKVTGVRGFGTTKADDALEQT